MILLASVGFLLWRSQIFKTRQVVELARASAVETARVSADRQLAVAGSQSNAQAPQVKSQQANAPSAAEEIAAIETLLRRQQSDWNAGDIDSFMKSYWHSEQLSFSSGGSTTRSWTSTLQRYKQKYPTPEAMGRLQFSDLEVQLLAPQVALVLGRWELEGKSGGNFSLVLKKLSSGWVIIHDHTSLGQTPEDNSAPN